MTSGRMAVSARSVIQRIKRPARLPAIQRGRGAEVIGLARFGARLRERFDNLPQMRVAAAGKNALLHMLPIDEQADAIAGEQRQLRQRHGGGAGVVELGVAATVLRIGVVENSAAQQPACVENDPHGLAALGLVAARDQLAAARCRRPADVAQVVALEIFAEALEVAAQAALARRRSCRSIWRPRARKIS